MYFKVGAAFMLAPLFVVLFALFDLIDVSFNLQFSITKVLLLLVIYPLCEEIIFRGFLQKELLALPVLSNLFFGLSVANLIVSLVFAMAHILYFHNIAAGLVFFPSLIFGWIFEYNRRVLHPIILHSWYNLFSLLYVPLW